MRKIILAGLIATGVMTSAAGAAETVTTNERILLQATMQQLIQRKTIAGKFFYFDTDAAKVNSIYPAKAHPKIMKMGDNFILCQDFRKSDGKPVNVDFYVARQDKGFVIFDTVVNNHEPIERLMKVGQIHLVK